MSGLRLEPIAGRRDLRRFIGATREIYRDDPQWVQPLTFERLQHLDPAKNPFLHGIELMLWMASRDGRPVGRISAQVNRRHLERHQDATGHFGFFEVADDDEAVDALVGVAADWLRARGMQRIAGPFSPSINDECGVLVDGFDSPPMMLMGHGRPWYARQLERQGFRAIKDLICHRYMVAGSLPPAAERVLRRVGKVPGLSVRPLDGRRFEAEIRTICDIFNDAWSENWGFIPFGQDEALHMAKSIRPITRPDYFAIAELHGEPAAMMVSLPNLNEAIRDLDGRLLPTGWAKLLWRLKVQGTKSGRIPLMGVRRRYHGTPMAAALALAVIERVRSVHAPRGVRWAELSWVLEDNRPMQDIIRLVGAVPYKTYRLYERPLA